MNTVNEVITQFTDTIFTSSSGYLMGSAMTLVFSVRMFFAMVNSSKLEIVSAIKDTFICFILMSLFSEAKEVVYDLPNYFKESFSETGGDYKVLLNEVFQGKEHIKVLYYFKLKPEHIDSFIILCNEIGKTIYNAIVSLILSLYAYIIFFAIMCKFRVLLKASIITIFFVSSYTLLTGIIGVVLYELIKLSEHRVFKVLAIAIVGGFTSILTAIIPAIAAILYSDKIISSSKSAATTLSSSLQNSVAAKGFSWSKGLAKSGYETVRTSTGPLRSGYNHLSSRINRFKPNSREVENFKNNNPNYKNKVDPVKKIKKDKITLKTSKNASKTPDNRQNLGQKNGELQSNIKFSTKNHKIKNTVSDVRSSLRKQNTPHTKAYKNGASSKELFTQSNPIQPRSNGYKKVQKVPKNISKTPVNHRNLKLKKSEIVKNPKIKSKKEKLSDENNSARV